ncbi:enoyl-CoA hydratase-related protein [Lutimaribacter sp. EGI FJ00015]|uniref:Enoyl-CoA hydratase-related protein n=1 Tax=Lutimaribacter degradans TaxID=2945989 RepID=A0ACC5ZYG3_9RHOB|nr:enoyl-CoA hydratase-related protein [Lutimaribacter sp. EGI FJ00013]MCM2563381.1 enoyl-CoA hydratase-related protein [Lutimaribacter sp. EGI FJ00013]MCO0614540.1 enoyl-CoA hydratase-related protein [Lutimaribacter sp. EGI FJ00015]MCO0637213.1 enoyl-CoA hydratase-related protein [Lutimaribacter sp. EGI FJ00014]
MSDTILIERAGAVTTLRLNDPATMNAMTPQMAHDLHDALKDAVAAGARAIILAGSERAFSTGANLKAAMPKDITGFDVGETLENDYNPLMRTIRDLPVPLISAVRGAAAGVGASLALVCDVIVAGKSAYFLEAFARIGLVPDGGATWLLTRAVGRVRAMEMMLLAEKIPAPQAHDWGLITRLAEDDAVEDTAQALAEKLADGPARAHALIRQAAWAAVDADFDTALQTERHLQKQAGETLDFAEGLAAFHEKRAPRFNG